MLIICNDKVYPESLMQQSKGSKTGRLAIALCEDFIYVFYLSFLPFYVNPAAFFDENSGVIFLPRDIMCGSFALTMPSKKMLSKFSVTEEVDLTPRYNIKPSQQVAVVLEKGYRENRIVMMRWGLIPWFAKDIKTGYKLINARGESLADKPSFRSSFKKRRCLIPADGFYESKQIPGSKMKQNYFVHMKGKHVFAFAGLWSEWENPADGKIILSCTIITTEANTLLAKIHDRMPVIIKEEQYGTWLAPSTGQGGLQEMLRPYDPYKMSFYKVSGMCNKAEYDSPGCIKKIN